MTSVFKFISKRMQPFRQCLEINQSPMSKKSNDSITKYPDSDKKITKKSNKKRKFNLKLKRSIKSNLDCIKQSASISDDSTAKHVDSVHHNETEKMEISSDIFEDPKQTNQQDNLYDTPISHDNTDQFINHDLNFDFSPFNGEFGSNIDHKRASCSTYDADCFPFQSVSNSSPANYSNNSMLTYNTKYDSSNLTNDEGMTSELTRQPSISLSSNMQQSTPYGKNRKRISNQIVKSQTTQFNYLNQIEEARTEVKKVSTLNKKCRRSNTTYTLAGKSSRIIDYFTNLELSKPLLMKANSRQVSRQSSRRNLKSNDGKEEKVDDFYTVFNDIEKLQDAFFDDSSVVKNEASSSDYSKDKSNSFFRNMNSITPPSSCSNTFNSMNSQQKTDSSGFMDDSTGFRSKSDNDTSTNSSMEKVRRAISSPGLILQNSMLLNNVSKISPVKNTISEMTNSIEETGSNSNMTETLTLVNDSNKDSTNGFKRGQPYNRSSKKIKQMFKNVLEKQMNALNKLEKFYESQVIFLEENRERDLKQNPDDKDLIDQVYDEKLRHLEERVQTNLKLISENKSRRHSKSSNENKENQTKSLTQTISQIMLLKQIQQSNNNSQNKSRALTELKSNLINQNNLLPSKVSLPLKRRSDAFENESQQESPFRRHMSLPFKQSKNMSINDRTGQMSSKIARSPKMSSLAYSSSRYNKHLSAASTLTSSPLTSFETIQPKVQYQKNSKKFSVSTENISQLRKLTDDLESVKNENTVLYGSKFAQIKRQNKSVSSIKSELMFEDKSILTLNEDSYRFQSSSYAKNNSFFSANLFALENSTHLVKYAAPRLSDCHIHYKIKMAVKNDKLNQVKFGQNLTDSQVFNKNLMMETEV